MKKKNLFFMFLLLKTKNILTKTIYLFFAILFSINISAKSSYYKSANAYKLSDVEQQQRLLKGTVTDNEGLPLPGVSVILNGYEGKYVFTDDNGKYEIQVKKGDLVIFDYMGFHKQQFIIEDQVVLDVKMELDVHMIDDIVAIGYGSEEKSKVSSAISSVDGCSLNSNLTGGVSFDKSLGGLIKGVRITQGSGRPGEAADINIRGNTSPFSGSNNNPLFVIDGVPFFGQKDQGTFNPLLGINSEDIESIDVLKDAAATAIYGSRGANGVIIINTIRGYKGEGINVSLSSRATLAVPIKTLNYLNAEEYKNYTTQMAKNSIEFANKNPYYSGMLMGNNDFGAIAVPNMTGQINWEYRPDSAKYGTANTNWANEVYRQPAYSFEYNASVSGGSERTGYLISLRHVDQEGLLHNDKLKQYNARLNLNTSINDKFNIGATLNIGKVSNKTGYETSQMGDNLNSQVLNFRPDLPIYNKNGTYHYLERNTSQLGHVFYSNPVVVTQKSAVGETNELNVIGNFYAELKLFSQLKLRAEISTSHFSYDASSYLPRQYQSTIIVYPKELPSQLSTTKSRTSTVVTDLTADYTKTIQKHTLRALLGTSWSRDYKKGESFGMQGFADNGIFTTPSSALEVPTHTGYEDVSGINSVFGRLTYDFDERYVLAATLRLDRTSKFAPDNRNAWFPSISMSWNVHNEEFLKTNDYINRLRFRASHGISGSTNVPDFTFFQFYQSGQFYNKKLSIVQAKNLVNSHIGWEKTRETNLGFDAALLQHRIRTSIDFYYRKTTDAISSTYFARESGAEEFNDNFATISNKGFEIDFTGVIIATKDFAWEVGLNISKNINELLEFNQRLDDSEQVTGYKIGREIGLIRGYQVVGIFQSQKEVDDLNNAARTKGSSYYQGSYTSAGDYKYKDVNGDGHINSKDYVILGSSQPDLFGGINSLIAYKGFELSAFFSYAYGMESRRGNTDYVSSDFTKNVEKRYDVDQRWSPNNTSAKYPRLILYGPNGAMSSAKVFDASYIRFKSLSLTYNLPKNVLQRMKINALAVTVSAMNLYTWTKFPGLDPESVFAGSSTGLDSTNGDPYPLAKSLSFGISLNF